MLFVAQMASAEEQAAWEWLATNGVAPARRVNPAELVRQLPDASVVWWHAASDPPSPAAAGEGRVSVPGVVEGEAQIADAILEWLHAGGSLWLTLHAAALLSLLGLEDRPPDHIGWPTWQHSDTELEAMEGERRGVVGFGPHPLFDGLAGGAMLLQPEAGKAYPEAVYTAPVRGRVAAAEWQYLTIDPHRRLVLEHEAGAGRVLTVGAHLLFGERINPFRSELERFASNCLGYLARPGREARAYWPAGEFAQPSRELGGIAGVGSQESGVRYARPASVDAQRALVSDGASDSQFDVLGRHIVLVGRERSGVGEIWSLPVRLAHNVSARFDGIPEEEALAEFRRLPNAVQRLFQAHGTSIVQTISAAGDQVVVAHDVGGELQTFELEFEVDLRYFWPYPEGVLGQPRLESLANELLVLDGEGTPRGNVRFEPWPTELEIASGSGPPRVQARFDQPTKLSVAFRAPEGMRRSLRMRSGQALLSRTNDRLPAAPAEQLLEIETPDDDFNEELFWAINGLRSFDVETPAGRGLAAGFAETGTGWWSGRLGYAWFFGRDTIWSSFACLGVGMREAVREALRLQAHYQSPEGKIFHELTPAGVGHFDAADSTPLFIVGLERYARWTGELELLRELWPSAQKALAFCASTDRDGDGLIENTGVGHGWSEGGPVYGAHATFYLNACWAAALGSMSALAEWIGHAEVANCCRHEFTHVRRLLNERFYRAQDRWFAYGLAGDGSLMPAKTIEPAVAALFGLLDADRLDSFFDEVASARYTAPWGVRYIANDDPAYHPRGYHHGSVWPLFTGWVSASEYAYGRREAAFQHLRSSLRLVRRGSLGAIDEVLNGDTGGAAGVCPHQLWSHAMTVTPIIEGMLGIRPDAIGQRLALRPQLPAEWSFVRVSGLQVGEHQISFSYQHGAQGVELNMASPPAGLAVEFAPR